MAQSEIYILDTVNGVWNFGVAGNTEPTRFYIRNKAGEVYDAENCTVYLAFVRYGLDLSTPDVSKTLTIIQDNDNSLYSIAVYQPLVADTINLSGKFEYQLTIKDISGNNDSIKGTMNITKNINKTVLS